MKHLSRKVKLTFAISLIVLFVFLIWQFPFGEPEGKAEHHFIDKEKQVEKIAVQSERGFTIEKDQDPNQRRHG